MQHRLDPLRGAFGSTAAARRGVECALVRESAASKRLRCVRRWLGVLVLLCVPSHLGAGLVTNTDDDGAGSLRWVIAAAPAGDTVTFSIPLPNTISLTSGEIAISRNLTILGPGPSLLAIEADHASRVFSIAPAATAAIRGLTIAEGRFLAGASTFHGGGCISTSGSLSLEHCVVRDCLAEGTDEALPAPAGHGRGGGIAVLAGGSLTVSHCTIENNRAVGGDGGTRHAGTGEGGGVWFPDLTRGVSISDTTFRGNQALGGTALLLGSPGCAFGGAGIGGGLAVGGGQTVVVERTTFAGNVARGGDASSEDGNEKGGIGAGGGLFQGGSLPVVVTNTTLSGNTATGGDVEGPQALRRADASRGGSDHHAHAGQQIEFCASQAGWGRGGGLAALVARIELVHATVTENTATDGAGPVFSPSSGGGGIAGLTASGIVLGQTIVTGNAAPLGADFLSFAQTDSNGYNLISTPPQGSGGTWVATDDVGNGTDPLLGPLGDNGGATQTRAIAAASPARDAIPPGDCTVAEDQRAVPRPLDGGCDIGAFEVGSPRVSPVIDVPALSWQGLALLASLLALAATALRRSLP